ncbi:hypothetical protein Snoj_39200 [Streptomyces nojiriensis]|uniref:Uncharacterized protein n=1 Tax=Streptomyces nojiriensis TaxID=66374 RepID=A0ABQ3SPE8_9ACTN|nr:hypothetical protein [Streptomyces nojiriensis]QTI43547.1 hypothetical protein JYK04_01309 [Streptomyces nojiriensis]GGR81773.1 hypothetical protein GCM10010205_07850 [Streptomyces nojiriensis]GHI70002.1 hypothetical protein Snoj_39200 [Streptomyces nojiriensis]
MSLFDADAYEPDEMLQHPRHLAMQPVLVSLIEQLRACQTLEDGVVFQRELLTRLLDVEKDRDGLKRAIARMRVHKAPQPQVPEPQSGRDLTEISTWEFEHDVCKRLVRQLRSIGDALAWRAFSCYRPFILALSRNDSPGLMYGKKGLPAELERVEQAWKEDGAFALLHDLTNCLRIGDVTVFNDMGPLQTEEVKTNPRSIDKKQLRRINQARAAVLHGDALPGGKASDVLCDLALPLRTHLDLLRTATERAAADGVYAIEIPGSRALLVVDQYGLTQLALPHEQAMERMRDSFEEALDRAGIGRRANNVHATSLDTTAVDPQRVPWANYPLHPVICARIIGDYTTVSVETSGPALAELLQVAGLGARWVRPPGNTDLEPGEVVMEIHQPEYLRSVLLPGGIRMTPGWTLQIQRSALDRYLIELLAPGSWVAGMKHVLAARRTWRPWPHYRNEHEVWV